MKIKTVLGWAVVIFIGYYLLTKPAEVSTAVHHLLGLLKGAGTNISAFLNSL